MTCKEAPACRAALNEATALWPGRSRASDGICGDAAHASRDSDHNPDSSGYAHAFDLTHDPAHGCDVGVLFAGLVQRRDPRVKYLIFKRTIWRSYDRPATATRPALRAWDPERYTGTNPHDKHGHGSIFDSATFDKSPWWTVAPTQGQEAAMAGIKDVAGYCLLSGGDLAITTVQGHVYHFDKDGNPNDTFYVDAYSNHPELGFGTDDRLCIGCHSVDTDGRPVVMGAFVAQVFNDGSIYAWVRKP